MKRESAVRFTIILSFRPLRFCHSEPFASCHLAQGKLREGSYSAQGRLREKSLQLTICNVLFWILAPDF